MYKKLIPGQLVITLSGILIFTDGQADHIYEDIVPAWIRSKRTVNKQNNVTFKHSQTLETKNNSEKYSPNHSILVLISLCFIIIVIVLVSYFVSVQWQKQSSYTLLSLGFIQLLPEADYFLSDRAPQDWYYFSNISNALRKGYLVFRFVRVLKCSYFRVVWTYFICIVIGR